MTTRIFDRTPLAEFAALLTGPVLIEISDEAPGHYLDLSQVLEFDDNAATQKMLVVLPAPSFAELTDDALTDGPYALLLSGQSRRLALAYVWFHTQRATEVLTVLADRMQIE